MNQINATNLTWTKNETAGTSIWYSQTGGYRIRREGGYYNLYRGDDKLNAKRTTKTICIELAEQHAIIAKRTEAAYDAACPDMPAIHAAPAFKPFLTEAENEIIDHAMSHTMPERDCLPIIKAASEVQEIVAGVPVGQNGQAIAAGCVCRCEGETVSTCHRHGRKPERIGGPDHTLAAQTERDVAAMDTDGDFIKPEYQISAESRKKKAQPEVVEINGEAYQRISNKLNGKATANLTSPRGDTYGCVLDGKDSKCSCPSFEHRSWCKHLTALVGERNAVFGVGTDLVEPPAEGGLIQLLRDAGNGVPSTIPMPPAGRLVYPKGGPDDSIRNVVNTPMPRPMPAAESRAKKAPAGKPLVETLFPEDDSEDIVRDEEPKGRGGRKGKRSNTESAPDSSPAIITPRIAENQTTAENQAKPQEAAPDATTAKPDALPAPQKAKPAKVFSAALENLRPGTKFKQGRFRGELLDVNAGDAKVSVREGSEPAKVVHWSPATVVRVGEPDETVEAEENPTAVDAENVIMRGGVVSENAVSSGGSAMKVNRAEYELVLSELGLPAAKLAKMSLKDLASKLPKLPDKASGRTIENERAAKTLKGLLKAIEDGEEIEIVGEEKPKKAAKEATPTKAKGVKAAKASANGNGHADNGHAKNGKAPKEKKAARARGDNAMSLLDAAEKVLSGTKKQLTTREIVEAAEKKGYWKPGVGKTPWDTLKAQLYVDIKKKGKQSRFKFVGKSVFELQS